MPKKAPREVDAYLAKLPVDQRKTVVSLRNAVIGTRPSLVQSLNPWGYVSFSTEDQKHVFVLVPHKQHVNLQIANGAKLVDDLPDLEGTGKGLRHIKFSYEEPVNKTLVGKAVRLSLGL